MSAVTPDARKAAYRPARPARDMVRYPSTATAIDSAGRAAYHRSYRERLAIVAIIPARYGASRLPGKPLSDIHGKPMIQHVYERVRRARGLDRVLVATDDQRIVEAVRAFGGEALMTSPAHRSGSDRLAEATAAIAADVIVGVQGDEPMIEPGVVEA